MNLDGGKTSVALNSMKEVHVEYAPEDASVVAGVDAFTAHFPITTRTWTARRMLTLMCFRRTLGQAHRLLPELEPTSCRSGRTSLAS